MLVVLSGIVMALRAKQARNASVPIVATELGKLALLSFPQKAKACSPIAVTVLGRNSALVRVLHP